MSRPALSAYLIVATLSPACLDPIEPPPPAAPHICERIVECAPVYTDGTDWGDLAECRGRIPDPDQGCMDAWDAVRCLGGEDGLDEMMVAWPGIQRALDTCKVPQ